MAGFSLRLETVLQHRRRIEEDCQRRLAAALTDLTIEKRGLAGIENSRDEGREEFHQKLKNNMTASEMLLYQKYFDQLAFDIADQKRKVAAAAQLFEKRRTELVAALKKRKVLDKLKEKQMTAAVKKELKQEQDFMNEMAVARYARPR
ncbi:MAG: flagellar export protein FliJ [Desulfobacterales bacterium]